MPLWHCPHCGTPQAETARCWVCRKSSTSCATCRHFRRGVAGHLGYCGLDRRRDPLGGDEIRGCWDSSAPTALGLGARPAEAHATIQPPIAWREVTDASPAAEGAMTTTATTSATALDPAVALSPTATAGDGSGSRPIPVARTGAGFWIEADL